MLEVLTGLISGIVSGTGMGGGTILILVLSVFIGIEQHTAQATNLIFFVPTSIAAIIIALKEKLIEWKTGRNIAVAGIIGAIIGSIIMSKLEVKLLRKCFAIFLAIIAIYEIYLLKKQYNSYSKEK